MKGRLIKIHYPNKKSNELRDVSKAIMKKVLQQFENGNLSYSSSNAGDSYYVMVYPTAPIATFRVSTHETDGSKPKEKFLQVSKKGGMITMNGEADDVDIGHLEFVIEREIDIAKDKSNNIKTIIKNNHKLYG